MPSAASRILRACLEASRAARSAASAASRCAAVVARSCPGGAAASDPSLRSPSRSRLSVRPGRSPIAARSRGSGSTTAAPPTSIHGPAPGKVTFVAEDKDLESDEALWALYERWCKAFNQERDYNEMATRFSYFKDTVLLVHHTNNADLPYKLGINIFADGKLSELMAHKVPFINFVRRRPCSVVSETSGDTLCKKDLEGQQQENANQSA